MYSDQSCTHCSKLAMQSGRSYLLNTRELENVAFPPSGVPSFLEISEVPETSVTTWSVHKGQGPFQEGCWVPRTPQIPGMSVKLPKARGLKWREDRPVACVSFLPACPPLPRQPPSQLSYDSTSIYSHFFLTNGFKRRWFSSCRIKRER